MRPAYDEETSGILFGAAAALATVALVLPAIGAADGAGLGVAGVVAGFVYIGYSLIAAEEKPRQVNRAQCPQCGTYNTEQLGNGFRECEECQTVFVNVGEVNVRVGKDPRVLLEA